ncbi:hydrolase [Novosphingobium sp. JCM 18896]|uniref:hydrolase n=1 Tax=Novosphingobium sp. JCM 18896 TaxID=2989731 RepID=UPI0022228400|nr:hydrolase [Novosphingobium sp. JCM 18896]MCW1427572.1 hydrolase [Novosphingobium sp. JCM 18896]
MTRDEAALVEPIARDAIADRVLAWTAINSGTANLAGLAETAALLADAFAVLPGALTLEEPQPVETVTAAGKLAPVAHGRHLVLRVRPEAERRVLLTGHMDTVYAADHPFQASTWLDADRLNGPGAADMKGGLALMLAGLVAFEAGRPTLGYDVLINSDEETGSAASAPLIAELARGKIAALTYEPALPGGGMARARPGSGNFAAVVTGRAAHAGRNPEDGRNAVVAAGDLALRLHRARHPALRINPAKIDGGGPSNSVPALAVLRVNLRPHGPAEAAEAQALLDRLVAEVACDHDVTIALHGHFGRPPKPIDAGAERLFALVSRAAADLGESLAWHDTGGVCDGNNIAACGVPVLDTMGARGDFIHSPQEYCDMASLVPRARLTALVLHRLDRGDGL